MTVSIRQTRLGGSALVRDYLAGNPKALPFFGAGNPFSLASYAEKLRHLNARFDRQSRERTAAALRPTSEKAGANLREWVDKGGAMVTTGQQAGLFTGPLFTLYKALTTVRLARSLETRLGVPVLPVFWVASEDHDWAEVAHTHLATGDLDLVRAAAGSLPAASRPLPVGERRFDRSIENALAKLRQSIGAQLVDARYLKYVEDAYREGRGVAEAFAQLLAQLLHPFDICIVDAADPALKRASAPVLRRAMVGAETEEKVLAGTAGELDEAGFGLQVPILPRAANLFVRTEHGRERLLRERTGWIVRESGERFTTAELERVLEADPGRVSPNVLLRPVVESAVFPVLAYVAGPGEIAYWGQLRGLFDFHDLEMPVVYPRASFLLVEARVERELAELGLRVADVEEPRHILFERRAAARIPEPVREALASLRRSLVEGFDGVIPEAAALESTLGGAVGAARNRALAEAWKLERKIVRAVKRADTAWLTRLAAVQAQLFPGGQPQERVLNPVPFLSRHGERLLHMLLEEIPDPFTAGEPQPAQPVAAPTPV
jgi:bacillithiol synthase